MDPLILWEALAILLLVIANGFFSGAEIAIITANRSRLKQLAESGDRKAGLALDLAKNPGLFLPTVQVGITLIGTFAAAFGGATIVKALEAQLAESPIAFLVSYRTEISLTIVVLSISFLSVVIGELVPKRVALVRAAELARIVARPMSLLARAARPFVWIMGKSTDVFLLLFGIRHVPVQKTSMLEIRHLIEQGTEEGVVDPVEQKLAMEALQLGDRTVRQIMKPRVDIDAVDVQTPQEELLGVIAMAGFSRLPVYKDNLDHIIGFVHLKDVLRQHYLGWTLDVHKLIRPALVVPDTMRLDQLLVRFQSERNQLAVVVDEFGSTRGMVTLEDVLEELVGELLTEHHERVEQLIVKRDDRSWLVDGTVSIADLLEHIGKLGLLTHAPKNVSSIGGLVMDQRGRIPSVGEKVEWHGLELEVVDLDGKRIDRLLVTLPEEMPKTKK